MDTNVKIPKKNVETKIKSKDKNTVIDYRKLDTNVKIPKKNVETKIKSKDKNTGIDYRKYSDRLQEIRTC